jgi:hypothetical protein
LIDWLSQLCSSGALALHEEPTTVLIQRYLDALPGDTAAEPIVREQLERSAGRTREAVPLLVTASAANPKFTLLSLKVAALQAWFGQDREFAATRQRILVFAKDTNEATTA